MVVTWQTGKTFKGCKYFYRAQSVSSPLSSCILRTKYRLESLTVSTVTPGYSFTGACANSSPAVPQDTCVKNCRGIMAPVHLHCLFLSNCISVKSTCFQWQQCNVHGVCVTLTQLCFHSQWKCQRQQEFHYPRSLTQSNRKHQVNKFHIQPETLSSSLMYATVPLAVILIRPDQSGASSFQSAALQTNGCDEQSQSCRSARIIQSNSMIIQLSLEVQWWNDLTQGITLLWCDRRDDIFNLKINTKQ